MLEARWDEFDLDARMWTNPPQRTKTAETHRVPLTAEILAIIEPLRALRSEVVFEGQRRHKPLSNMAMLMLLRRMKIEGSRFTASGPPSAIGWRKKPAHRVRLPR